MLISPATVELALNRARPEWKESHKLNENHTLVKGCKLGTVFNFQAKQWIYVGVAPRNWKYPCVAYNPQTNNFHKMTRGAFRKVILSATNETV